MSLSGNSLRYLHVCFLFLVISSLCITSTHLPSPKHRERTAIRISVCVHECVFLHVGIGASKNIDDCWKCSRSMNCVVLMSWSGILQCMCTNLQIPASIILQFLPPEKSFWFCTNYITRSYYYCSTSSPFLRTLPFSSPRSLSLPLLPSPLA